MSVFGVILFLIFPAFSRIRTEYGEIQKCPYSELFWSLFSPNAGKYGKNVDQKNSEYGHFLCIVRYIMKHPQNQWNTRWLSHERSSNHSSSHCTKNNFSIKDFFSKCDQIRRKLQIWSHLLKKSLMENFIFCAVSIKIFLQWSIKKDRIDTQ